MKSLRNKTVIGIALGERSLAAAQVDPGETPDVAQVVEFVYPTGVEDSAALGKALGDMLKAKGFSARTAVVGLPARRLVVKAKEVPPTDRSTLSDMLRLQAEGEFAAELKDLVYDYDGAAGATNVLLVATPRANIDHAMALCRAAGLSVAAVTSTGVALARVTADRVAKDAVILATSTTGTELTAIREGRPTALRHLRAIETDKGFAGEVRRAVLPLKSADSKLVVWGASPLLDVAGLGTGLGMPVVPVDLGKTGMTRESVPAVAVAMAATADDEALGVDFLHTKLAPPKEGRIPRWAVAAALGVVLLVAGGAYAYYDLQKLQDEVAQGNKQYASMVPTIEKADSFRKNAGVIQGWKTGHPRYLACLKDVTATFPEDGQTFGIDFRVREIQKPTGSSSAALAAAAADAGVLACQLSGKTTDARRAQSVQEAFIRNPVFSNVKNLGVTETRGVVSFSLTFNYRPEVKAAATQQLKQTQPSASLQQQAR